MNNKLILLIFLFSFSAACKQHAEKKADRAKLVDKLYQNLDLKSEQGFMYSTSDHQSWSIVGGVYSDRKVTNSLESSEGYGILVNHSSNSSSAALQTKLKHGDMDIELDFMMPKGSNSEMYFMGRYGIQLADSWLKPSERLSTEDCGGIYIGKRDGKDYSGHPPLLNACKAPGLWQHLKVRFQAPHFNTEGKKISNARFLQVYLNGALIQENVELISSSQGALFSDEKPLGPLVFEGNMGPIAFKNIRYRLYNKEQRIEIKDLKLKIYEGFYSNIDTLNKIKPKYVLLTDSISQLSYDKFEEGFYSGTMEIPDSGNYLFKLQAGGPSWLWIDSQLIANNNSSTDYSHIGYGMVPLNKGNHSFSLIHYKRYEPLQLSYEATYIPVTSLTTPSSALKVRKPKPYVINVKNNTIIQRGFFMYHDEKRTHVIAVGLPDGINFAYDLNNYNLLTVWRGAFIDVADMWRERGEQQLELPLGGILELSGKPAVQFLRNKKDKWPHTIPADSGVFVKRSYQLNKRGTPLFFYSYKGIDIKDYIHFNDSGKKLLRELSFSSHKKENDLYFLLADGKLIEKLPDGSYAVDNYNYYITYLEGPNPEIIKEGDSYRLLVPLEIKDGEIAIKYNVIW